MTRDEVESLWFDGDAWCKTAALDDRSDPEGRPYERRIAEAVATWRAEATPEAAHAVLVLLVDDLLCEQLPESSWFAEYERRPWRPCTKVDALAIAEPLQRRLGCEASARALPWFAERLDAGQPFRFDHRGIEAVAVVTPALVAFFLDRG